MMGFIKSSKKRDVLRAKLLPSGKVEIISSERRSHLFDGQNVVVVEETNVPIYSSITGRNLGRKECVLGRGRVIKMEGQKMFVKMTSAKPGGEIIAKEGIDVIIKPTLE